MCPGLTSPGAKLCDVPANTVVAIMAEGKKHAVAVGVTTMSTNEMLDINKNIGVETLHYLNDGLWQMRPKYGLPILATSILILTAWKIIQPDYKSADKTSVNHTLAVVVPFRDRFTNLLSFLPHMHQYLNRKGVPHTFYIVNQADDYRFNRGSLLNVGVRESEIMESQHFESSMSEWTQPQPACSMVALHDVDLLPIDDDLRYEHFGRYPYHLIPYWMHPLYYAYSRYIGGAIIISRESYKLINGFSNRFWGWGHEDDEFGLRMREANLVIQSERKPLVITPKFQHLHSETYKRERSPYDVQVKTQERISAGIRPAFVLKTTNKHLSSEINLLTHAAF
ncbi:Beta-14-galactosyltransferase 7 [Taenia solium]|eukprot:TsM_000934800 transcript=TsM_000934800 gene=TsM_000934800